LISNSNILYFRIVTVTESKKIILLVPLYFGYLLIRIMEKFDLFSELKNLQTLFNEGIIDEGEFIGQKKYFLQLHRTYAQNCIANTVAVCSEYTADSTTTVQPPAVPEELSTPLSAKGNSNDTAHLTPANVTSLNTSSKKISKSDLVQLISASPTKMDSIYIKNESIFKIPETPSMKLANIMPGKKETNIIESVTLDVAEVLKESFQNNALHDFEALTSAQFWSIVLGEHIPEGDYYPAPEQIREAIRKPFFIQKDLIDLLLECQKENGMKNGTSTALASFHTPVHDELPIPWCIRKINVTKSDNTKYHKNEFVRIDWYCP
jgi:hypothetical protein